MKSDTSRAAPQQARAKATRRKLLNAAVQSLCESGCAGTTTTVVANRAGVSQGALYKHFGSKHQLIAATVEHFGSLDVLVNNASSFYPTPLGSITEEQWDDLLGSNLKAPLFLCQAALPHLKESQGVIINIIDVSEYSI